MLGGGLHSTEFPPSTASRVLPTCTPEESCPASHWASGCLTSQEEPLKNSCGAGPPSGTLRWEQRVLRVAKNPVREPGMDMERQPWLPRGAGVRESRHTAPALPSSRRHPPLQGTSTSHAVCVCRPFPPATCFPPGTFLLQRTRRVTGFDLSSLQISRSGVSYAYTERNMMCER